MVYDYYRNDSGSIGQTRENKLGTLILYALDNTFEFICLEQDCFTLTDSSETDI